MVKPKTINTTVYKAKLFHVDTIHVTDDNGEKITREVVISNPTVSVFPLNDRYDLSLIIPYNIFRDEQKIEAITQFTKDNEIPLKTAEREIQEVAGIRATQWEMLMTTDLATHFLCAKNYLFLAKGLETGESYSNKHKDSKIVTMPLEEAMEKVMTGEITHSSTIIGILLLDKFRKEKKL